MKINQLRLHPVIIPILLFIASIVVAFKAYQLDFSSMLGFPWIFSGSIFLFGGISLLSNKNNALILRASIIVISISLSAWGGWIQNKKLEDNRLLHGKNTLTVLNTESTPLLNGIVGVNVNKSVIEELTDTEGKVTIVNFWATWCTPCREELPVLEKFWQENKNSNLRIIAITRYFKNKTKSSNQKEIETAKVLVNELGLTFPVGIDTTGTIFKDFNVRPIPCTVLLDQKGHVIDYEVGLEGAMKILSKAKILIEI